MPAIDQSEYNRNLIEVSLDPLVTIGPDGKIADVNKATEKVTGLSRDELIGTDFSKYFTDPQKAKEGYEQVFKEGYVKDYPLEIRHKDGHITSVLYNASVYKDESGKVIGVFAAARDITEQKKIEEALKKSEADLQEAQRLAHIGSWSWDIAADKIIWSPEYFRIGNFDPKLPTPNYQEHLKAYSPETAKKLDEAVQKTVKTGEPYMLELEYIKPDVKGKWIIARGAAKRDATGKIVGLYGTAQDITDRKKEEHQLEELYKVRNKFIEIISHQLRTPLGVINWNLETLLKGEFGKMDPTQQKFLQATYERSIDTTQRIHDLLTAMDVEENRVRYEKEDVAIDSICAAVISEKKESCMLKSIDCSYIAPEAELPSFEGDNEKIRTVVTKLVDNAVNYTKPGGKITAKLLMEDHIKVRFEISDNGIGIPESEQHRIFDRFFRASNASVMVTDGFGLGLYLAKHFVEQHRGTIGFTSKEGVGSTFWFELPIQ